MKCFCYLVLVSAVVIPGYSSEILTNQWYSGLWNPSNQQLTNDWAYVGGMGTYVADPGSAPWTFNNSTVWSLLITDLGRDGDSFDVFDNNVAIGSTSIPTDTRVQCGDDPLGCTGAQWSHGNFIMTPGGHSITMVIKTHASDSDRGNNAFMVVAHAPEPGTIWLLLCGALLLLLSRVLKGRWRRVTSTAD